MSSNQKIEFKLQSQAYVPGGSVNVDLSPIPAQIAGRITHLEGIKFVVNATPTLSSGSVTPEAFQKMIASLVIKDGPGRNLMNGSFGSLRLYEALENGNLFAPEPDPAATTEAVNFIRNYFLGPQSFEDTDDFIKPACLFRGGSVQIGFGSLASISATLTALSATVQPYAILSLHDDLIIGAEYERFETQYSSGQVLGTEALYPFFGLCKSNAFANIATGDIGNVTVNADGFTRNAVHVADLERMMHQDLRVPSGITIAHGEQRAATDDNPKYVNNTAMAAANPLMSSVLWCPDGAMISKIAFAGKGNFNVQWDGAASQLYALTGRIIPRTEQMVGAYGGLISAALGLDISNLEVRTLSGRNYGKGPRKALLPLKSKLS